MVPFLLFSRYIQAFNTGLYNGLTRVLQKFYKGPQVIRSGHVGSKVPRQRMWASVVLI